MEDADLRVIYARFRDGFAIAELGFGTGLNFLVTLAAWREAGCAGRFRFTSFEAFPMAWADMQSALTCFKDLPTEDFKEDQGTLARRITGLDFDLEVIVGDARETLAMWEGRADAWFLDGFSPAKNPELWEPALMAQVAQHTLKGGSFATYTAAGFVRRGLEDAGFVVERVSGYGRKRHMTIGKLA